MGIHTSPSKINKYNTSPLMLHSFTGNHKNPPESDLEVNQKPKI